jgi:hypothetical protein
MLDPTPAQFAQRRFDPLQIAFDAGRRRNHRGARGDECLDVGRAQVAPGRCTRVLDFEMATGLLQCGAHRLRRKIMAEIAEIRMQARPHRIVVVRHDRGRQTGAQCIEAVADERRNHHRADAEIVQHGRQVRGIFR